MDIDLVLGEEQLTPLLAESTCDVKRDFESKQFWLFSESHFLCFECTSGIVSDA
ncbi:hypothetical protein J1N35_019366 [Gossypium stocksii]|uniref:Uncharacterized protein n=1 Tax=Gossypium stocksii TaxID=47602 RepID=A0A9D4A719_9ROSI|nr:hypothetical protein J1N35_019366 [Gossypium stocksii]